MGIYDKYKKLVLPLTSVKTQVTTALPGVIGRTVTTGLGNEGIDLAIWINEKLQDNTIEIPGLAELIQLTGMPEGSTTLGSFNGNIIPDNSSIKQALQILETAVMGAGGGSGLNGIYTGSGDIASNVVANVTDSFSINTSQSGQSIKIGDINNAILSNITSTTGFGLLLNSGQKLKLGAVFQSGSNYPFIEISKLETSIKQDSNNYLRFPASANPELRTDKLKVLISTPYASTFQGLTYELDYSNNYTPRSLVDKAYVDLKAQIVADGDKGDITLSNNGSVWLVNNNVLTYSKLQNTTGSKLLGRYDSTTGTIQEIALGTGLAFVNNTLVSTGGSGGILLTTNNSSGPATLNSGTLNIPNYSLTGLGGVPTTRTITINGETYDLSQNRSWTINSMIYPSAGIPVSTGTAWGTSIVNNSTNWNTAFSWGNHALVGYLTSYTETDPTVPSHVKAITTTNISNWNSAYGWGNHATQGYLTSAAIGVTVQPYNANTVIDGSYVHTDNNYTTTEKSKLAGIQAGAEVNVNADWNAVSGDAQILNKPTIPLVDSVPTSGSTNAVSSGSVFTALSFKADLVGGKVPAYQLPSFVDDVLEGYYNGTNFYIDSDFATLMTGETGKIYINLLNNTSYRYTGSVYVQISNSISTLNDLTDVTIGTLNNGQILQYNGTTSQWENVSVTIGSGDMQKSVYDIDNDGIVDYSETISVTVRNNSSTNILRRGTIVYLSGSTGNRPNAFKAQANAESTSSGTFGVVVNDIGTNSDGLVAAMGTLHNLDTRTGAGGNPNPFTSDTLLDGDILWLDPTTAGYVTKTKPSAPNHAVFIGIVAATSPTNGRIVYKIQNGYEIEELHNVKITEPLLNNQVLRYNNSNSLWENKTLNFQVPLTLTTSGTSGAATLAGDGVLNIPNYSTAPGGNTTEVQFNNSSAFGGSSKFTWSNDVLSLNTLTSPVSPVLQLSSYFSASGNEGKIGTRIYNVGQDFPVDKSMGILSFDVASGLMTNWQTAMSLISNFDINDNLQNVTLNVNGGLSLTNIPLITTDATNVLGVTSNGSLGKLSLDASTLSLSSAGVLSGVIKTLNDLTDVVVSSPTSGQVLSYNGTNWVNTTGGGGGVPAGANTQIQFNNSGVFGASSNLTWSSNLLNVSGNIYTSGSITTTSVSAKQNQNLILSSSWADSTATVIETYFNASNILLVQPSGSVTRTAGNTNIISGTLTFTPTSGNATATFINIGPTINQTGGASGTTRGLYINPTLTSAPSWRSVEWTNNIGYGLYGSGTATNYLAGGLTIGNTALNSSAILQVDSTTKGFLPPRMTTANRTAISATPTAGLVIYNSDVNRLQVYNGTTWVDESKYALNRQTASYTLVLSDTGKLVETNVATANTVTVPLNSTQAFEVGARIDIIQYGAGQTTITPTAGVTIRSANGWTKINAQYGAVSLVKIGTDEWYLFGNLNA
jgi:hypothetical protein